MPVDLALTRDQLLDHARALPAAPRVMAELCELLQDINTDLDQVAGVIRADPALGARVIRISNSVVYGGGLQVSSIDEAVNRVGFEEVLRLVGTASVAGFVDRSLTMYGIEAEDARASLLLHALACEALARETSLDPHTAYTAGLLRGMGMMVLDRAARGKLGPAFAYDPQHFPTYLEWETKRFGLGSPDVTRMVLDEWRFPDVVISAIDEQLLLQPHHLENALACLVNLAGAVVNDTGLALPGDRPHWSVTPEKLAGAGIDEGQFHNAAELAWKHYHRQSAGLSR